MKQTWGSIKDGSFLTKNTPGKLHFDMTNFQAIFIVLTKQEFWKAIRLRGEFNVFLQN